MTQKGEEMDEGIPRRGEVRMMLNKSGHISLAYDA
jgi:hypothetical protein